LGQVPMIWIGGSLEKSRTQASIRLLRLIPVPQRCVSDLEILTTRSSVASDNLTDCCNFDPLFGLTS
jgi:hypothetical protein